MLIPFESINVLVLISTDKIYHYQNLHELKKGYNLGWMVFVDTLV